MNDLMTIRPMIEGDKNLILNSWLVSYYQQEQSHSLKGITKGCFMDEHRAAMLEALSRSLVFCATDRHDTSQIYGWVCVEPEDTASEQVLHFVYVKHPFRQMGICKALLKHSLGSGKFCFTHKPTFGLAKHLFENAKFNHYRFFRRKAA